MSALPTCFALLDDASSEQAQSRLYTELVRIIDYSTHLDWSAFVQDAQAALSQGYYVLALLSYETGAQLQEIADRHPDAVLGAATQFASRFLVFKKCELLHQGQVTNWLAQQMEQPILQPMLQPTFQPMLQPISANATHPSNHTLSGVFGLRSSVTQEEFTQAIDKILAYIQAGDTYQVNYTYRLHFHVYGSILHLYTTLRQRQPVPYGALICLPNGEAVLSLSPELFIRHQEGLLFARPMKGTAAASGNEVQDQLKAQALSQDEKNRAENVMIVDLLRNDLGKIAKTGTVKVNKLFDVHRYASVLQMTSDIQAQLRDDVNLADTLHALFPCGSITGAPKRRTMEIIREIETENRGLYTGAIGWFDPPTNPHKLGDFCLSVPIRTLSISTPDQHTGLRHGVMGVGAGIVHDSVAQAEFEECQLKARFLTGIQTPFYVFETMRASKENACPLLAMHLQRLQASVQWFASQGIMRDGFDADQLQEKVRMACAQMQPHKIYRLRLAITENGEVLLDSAELAPLSSPLNNANTNADNFDNFATSISKVATSNVATSNTAPVNIVLNDEICHTPAVWLAHKTSIRNQYDRAWKEAEKVDAFDAIFVNPLGYVTEGGRSNIFIRQNQQWFTPPLSDGVLPGVMRALILQEATWNASEKQLIYEDVLHADEIMICNALRGVMRAKISSI